MAPTEGDYGSEVTVLGNNLGSVARSDVRLVLGGGGEVVITPNDEEFVKAWNEDRLRFRFAFPAEGVVAIETPQGAVMAGDFKPNWLPGDGYPIAPGASVIASVAAGNGQLAVVIDTTPPTLARFSASGRTEEVIAITGYRDETLRLYLGETLEVEGFALSDTSPPEVIQLDPDGSDGLVASPTGLLVSNEFVLAGGSNGAVVWYSEADAWRRARPADAGWTVDKGPIADPDPMAPDHAAGATSDGSLWARTLGGQVATSSTTWSVRYASCSVPMTPALAAHSRAESASMTTSRASTSMIGVEAPSCATAEAMSTLGA